MRLYPGGTWWDRTTQHGRFWDNYLCDLEWEVALDGQPNVPGARVARWAMLALALGFVPFWLALEDLLARLGARRPTASAVRGLGLVSVAGLLAVILMPSERFGALHGLAVVTASVPGLAAAGLAVAGLRAVEPGPRLGTWTGATLLATSAVDLALYVSHLLAHVEGTRLVVWLEKLALLLLATWMIEIATASWRRSRARAP